MVGGHVQPPRDVSILGTHGAFASQLTQDACPQDLLQPSDLGEVSAPLFPTPVVACGRLVGGLRTTTALLPFSQGAVMAIWRLMPSPLLSPGTFCALDICLSQLQDVGTLNIYQTVLRMRTQRAFSIQTPEQYYFCYTAILEHAQREGLLLANHNRAGQEKSSPGH